jgi:cytochrome P450
MFAAMDPLSNAFSRMSHLLASHPEVQEKLRVEVMAAWRESGGKDLSYDTLNQLPYMDAVCRETLRL